MSRFLVYTSDAMHLYVHIPFCDGKCAYCGFYSTAYSEAKGQEFVGALSREFDGLVRSGGRTLKTIYFGGGTPSVLSETQLEEVTSIISGRFEISSDVEWTVEGSPNTLNMQKIALLKNAGVNRISVGVQTFCDDVLQAMGRRHTSEEGRLTLKRLASDSEIEIGCDLIAGLPGVSREDWRKDVETICSLGLTHVSAYALSLEEGTRLFHEHGEGKIKLPEEEEFVARLEECGEILDRAGIKRYEVSNYAVPGHECRHNLCYWEGADYYGAGPGASSRLGRIRRTNAPDAEAYIQAADAPYDEERVSSAEDLQERFIYHFRLKRGIDMEAFCAERNVEAGIRRDWERRLELLAKEGLLLKTGTRYMTTDRGMDLADAIAESFLE